MKKIILFSVLIAGSFLCTTTNAQISIGLHANIGVQPLWAPTGYDHADYYYIPDIEAYYSVSRHQYVYQQNNRWTFSASLPYKYRNFDMYHAHKVVMNEPRPYLNHEVNRTRYAEFRGRHDQEVIRDSHERKYFENKGHPQHKEWNNGHDNRGHDKH